MVDPGPLPGQQLPDPPVQAEVVSWYKVLRKKESVGTSGTLPNLPTINPSNLPTVYHISNSQYRYSNINIRT